MKDLVKIGVKINDSIEAVWKIGLTTEEIESLEDYMRQQETILPLINPNFIQQAGFKLFDQAKERIKLLKPIIELKQIEKEGR